ncbi:MAG: hypothetical protein KBS65_01695 [Prevotella sp.]|nr:hypothetical protein [Candidatus Equicola stercoris]
MFVCKQAFTPIHKHTTMVFHHLTINPSKKQRFAKKNKVRGGLAYDTLRYDTPLATIRFTTISYRNVVYRY